MYEKKKKGIYRDPCTGRTMQHEGYATRIYWSKAMTGFLRRHFPTTLNDELAGCLGVSPRTMVRKARELGLQKDPEWLAAVWEERRRMAQSAAKRMGHPNAWKKGQRANPDGEFKHGHKESAETKARRIESIRKWNRRHPHELKARAAKAWATRRANEAESPGNTPVSRATGRDIKTTN